MLRIIINPASRSGKGLRIWNRKLKPYLESQKIDYEAVFTEKDKSAAELVRQFVRNATAFPIDIWILGGDGTMNEAIQGIDDFAAVRLAYLPTGSSNDLARDLKIDKSLIRHVEHLLKEPLLQPCDIGEATYTCEDRTIVRRFDVGCGIGFDAAVCWHADHSKAKTILNKVGLGKLVYLFIALGQIFGNKADPCSVYLDDAPPITYDRFLFAVGMIHRYEGGGFMFCPHADASDGLLDVCIVGPVSKLGFLSAMPAAFKGKHIGKKHITEHRAREMRIVIRDPRYIHTDGEVRDMAVEVEMHCIGQQLQLLI